MPPTATITLFTSATNPKKQNMLSPGNINIINAWRNKQIVPNIPKSNKQLGWVKKHHKKIYEYIKTHYKTNNSIKTHLVTLGKILRLSSNPIWKKYSKEATDLNMEVVERGKKQLLTDEEIKNWMSYEDIIKKREELKKKHKQSLKDHFNYLILCLYTYQAPLRGEWSDMKIWTKNTPVPKDKNNYITNTHIIINHDKVSSKIGRGEIKIDDNNLLNILNESFILYPRSFVLTQLQKSNINDPLLTGGLRRMLNQIFKPKKVGTNILRKSYITNFYKSNPTYKQKEDLSKKMRSSVFMAETAYRKI